MYIFFTRKIIIGVLFLLSLTYTQAQQLTLDDLLTVHAKSETERESYLLRKGYDFEETKTEKIETTEVIARFYAWKTKSSNKNSARTMLVTRGKSPTNKPLYETCYITFEKYDYTSLKTNALLKGYKYVSSTIDAERVNHHYENDKSRLVFYTATMKGVYVYGLRVLNK